LSKELLKQIGENWYGDQWQAPLARELDVGERSMRRWAAGTDDIPRGVWRDILFRLEARYNYAEFHLGEVRSILDQVQVCAFQCWDPARGEMVQGIGKSTPARIAKIGGDPILKTAEWVPADEVDAEGRLKPVELSPLSGGFQTQVTNGPRSGR
jgi:hypothetical protein